MICRIGVADMHAAFENSKMHMHVLMLLSAMQFNRSIYSTLCGLACSAEMKWSLHGPIACCRATMARISMYCWPSDMQKCVIQNWQLLTNAETWCRGRHHNVSGAQHGYIFCDDCNTD